MDFLKEFTDIIARYSDIPDAFITASALSLSSSLLGRFFKIAKARNKRPNLYIVLASAPGIGRRGDMLSFTNLVKNVAILKYHKQIKSNDALDDWKTQLLEGGSKQGIADDIVEFRKKNLNCFTLNSTEFGAILDTMKKHGGYQEGMNSLLCKLWSGETHYESFSKRGDGIARYVPSGTYFNIYSTCQKIDNYLDNRMSQTGFCRRLLIFSVNGKDLTKYIPPLGSDEKDIRNQLEDLGSNIGKTMYGYHRRANGKIIDIIPDQDAIDIINFYAEPWEMKARLDDDNPYYLYQQTRWEYVLKVAANLALLRGSTKITKQFVDEAIPIVDNSTKDIRTILERGLILPKMRDPENHMEKIVECYRKGMTNREVLQYMSAYGVHAKKKVGDVPSLVDYVNILVTDGKLKQREDKHGFEVIK